MDPRYLPLHGVSLDGHSSLAPSGSALALATNPFANMVGLEAAGAHKAFANFPHLVFGLRFFIHF